MNRLKSTLPNMVLSLTLITAFCGAVIGVVYSVTKEPIEKQAVEMRVQAIRDVVPAFDNDPEADIWVYRSPQGGEYDVYPAFEKGVFKGAAVKTFSMDGFSGEITVMVGFDADGTVHGYQVLSHAETPGLGAKMQEWFRDDTGMRSIVGKNPSKVNFHVSKDPGGEIDGITAATISSRAFLGSVRSAYEAFEAYKVISKERTGEL